MFQNDHKVSKSGHFSSKVNPCVNPCITLLLELIVEVSARIMSAGTSALMYFVDKKANKQAVKLSESTEKYFHLIHMLR